MRCFAALMVALVILSGPGAVNTQAQTPDWEVPSAGGLDYVINTLASAGEWIEVSNRNGNNDPYDPITMKSGIRVSVAAGQSPKITGSGAAYAVTFPSDSDEDTILEGFAEITAGSSGGIYLQGEGIVRNCLVRSTETGGSRTCIYAVGANLIEDCEVEIARGTGITLAGTYGTASGCSVSGTDSTNYCDGIWVSGNSLAEDSFASVPGGTGFYVTSGQAYRCTVDGARNGFIFSSTVASCIAANCWEYGFDGGVSYSATYCIAPGGDGFESGSMGGGSVNEDPLFCDASNGAYTLRIDSYGNPENNGDGLIGAFPVACAYGELVRSTTVAQDAEILVMSDVLVPSSTSLTLEEGVVFEMDDYDEDNLGEHATKVELFVDDGGSLTVSGRSSNPVEFVSSDETAGDWYGITIANEATAAIDTALVQYSSHGIVDKSGETTSIRGCTFQDNETYDIVVGYSGDPDNLNDATVSGNTIIVGSGTGIELQTAFISGTLIEDNSITGSSASYQGIEFGNYTSGSSPVVDSNTISGFSNGSGIYGGSDAVIIPNRKARSETFSHVR